MRKRGDLLGLICGIGKIASFNEFGQLGTASLKLQVADRCSSDGQGDIDDGDEPNNVKPDHDEFG